jgi:hypothetical protein
MIRSLVIIAGLALTESASARAQQSPPSLTGKWAVTIGTRDNPEYRTLDVVVGSDATISGTIGSPNGAVPIQSGRVDGVRFSLSATLGTGIRLAYDGTLSRDSIRGTWRYDKFEGAFVGLRGTVPPLAAVPEVRGAFSVDARQRAATVDSLLREVAGRYVDTSLVLRITSAIQQRLRNGAYDTLGASAAFARAVTADLRQFDKHLAVIPVVSRAAVTRPAGNARENFGIKRIERLEGNVGYLKLDMFSVDAGAFDVLRDALRFLARTDALIIGLRDHRGGSGALSKWLFANLVENPPRETADMFTRTPRGFDSTAIQTPNAEIGVQYRGRPVYVLTSARTASAAEWLSYDLQGTHRATLVGEVTAGAAHPIQFIRLSEDFDASIPIGRVRSRITHTDFEGVGVQPDTKVAAPLALETAYGELLQTLIARSTDPLAKAELERAIATRKASS